MTRTNTRILTLAAATMLLAGAAHARPIFMQYEGVDGSCSANSNQVETFVGGQRVVHWLTPTGQGSLVFTPSAENGDRPIEEVALYYNKISFSAAGPGASITIADDVVVDGQVITGAVWAQWRKGDGGAIELNFGKSREAPGRVEMQLKVGGTDGTVATIIDCGWVPLVCDHLTTVCPLAGVCNGLCEGFCDTPSSSRPDVPGAVAIDLPFQAPTTFMIPGRGPVTADAVSVVLHPVSGSPMTLAAKRLSISGLPGLQITSARGEFGASGGGCPSDINDSGALSVQDIFDFLAKYFGGSPDADFNNSGGLTVQDLFDYLAAYFRGCP